MSATQIFRDDDISCFTKLEDFKRIHELFIKYNVTHTIAVIAKDIETHPELVEYIKFQPLIDVQLHCWEHYDFTENLDSLQDDLRLALDKIYEVFKVTPTILFPPWNRTNEFVNKGSADLLLTVSAEKISLSQYVRKMGAVSESVINFHYWADQETMLLEQALKIYTRLKHQCV